ncbi:contractile injection system tape measure protein [Enterobacter ludwigii]
MPDLIKTDVIDMNDHGINIDIVRCNVLVNSYEDGVVIIRSHLLQAHNLNEIIYSVMGELNPGGELSIPKLVIDLGTIRAGDFIPQFNQRLALALRENIIRLIADASHRFRQLPGKSKAETAEAYPLALLCLQPEGLQQLMQTRDVRQQKRLMEVLSEHARENHRASTLFTYRHVTASRLSLTALVYLFNNSRGRRWLIEHHPDMSQLMMWENAIICGEVAALQVMQLLDVHNFPGELAQLTTLTRRWLLPLWQKKKVREVVIKHAGKVAAENIAGTLRVLSPQPSLRPASNAGLVLLWPLLPQLFSLLEFCQNGKFTSDGAREQAVLSLDWLVWAEAAPSPTAARLSVNRLLCGISADMPLPEPITLTVPQRQQIDDWLTAVIKQLPSGHKSGINDIRVLFLQRPGDINLDTLPPQVRVQPEPFDYLLADVPWPLTLASLPWLEQPLTLIWSLPHLTG